MGKAVVTNSRGATAAFSIPDLGADTAFPWLFAASRIVAEAKELEVPAYAKGPAHWKIRSWTTVVASCGFEDKLELRFACYLIVKQKVCFISAR